LIAVDTNVLVYAHREESEHNDRCYGLLASLAAGTAPWGIPSPCLAEFLCVVTHPRYLDTPTPSSLAIEQIRYWLAASNMTVLRESARTWDTLRELVDAANLTGPRVYDGRIAAICLDRGVREIWSADRDFSKFPKLRTRNPLVDE
jgi:toxin-antitoxin system PIN domain toxin